MNRQSSLKQRISLAACMATSLALLAGCAGPRFLQHWPGEFLAQAKSTTTPAAPIRPLVIVRFPSSIATEQREAAISAYRAKITHYGAIPPTRLGTYDPAALDAVLLKSSYHGLILAKCLRRSLQSSADVIAEPFTIGYGSGNSWRQVSEPRPLAASVVVDFLAYVSPRLDDRELGYSSVGNLLMPKLSVRLPLDAVPSTRGAVAMDGIWFYIARTPREAYPADDARSGLGAGILEFLETPGLIQPKPGYLTDAPPAWTTRPRPLAESRTSRAPPWQPGKVVLLTDHLSIQLDPLAIERGEPSSGESSTCQVVHNLISSALVSQPTATQEERRLVSYAARFVADGKRTTPLDSTMRTFLQEAYRAEVTLLRAQDDKLASAFLSAAFLQAYAASLNAEQSVADEMARQASTANLRMAAIVLSGLAAAVQSGAPIGGAGRNAQMLETARAADRATADIAYQSLVDISSASRALADTPAAFSVGGDLVRARSAEELRKELILLFRRRFP